jgi:hypothetical protein
MSNLPYVQVLESPCTSEFRYRTSWTEFFFGVCLWTLVFYGWRRALSYSSAADVLNSVAFTVLTIVAYASMLVLYIFSRVRVSRRYAADRRNVPSPAVRILVS